MELTTRQILKRAKRGLQDALNVLPEAAVKLDAVRFFAIFTAVMNQLNNEERKKLMDSILLKVQQVNDFTTSDTIEMSRAFLLSICYLTNAEIYEKELWEKCQKSFPKTFKKFAKEYHKILDSWKRAQELE
jgi:hypothetical protein